MRVLVTGSSGFIGTYLCGYLAAKGHDVVGIDKSAAPATQVICEILDGRRLTQVLQDNRPDAVIHLAANADITYTSLDDYRANTDGVTNLMSALKASPSVRTCIFTSSQAVAWDGPEPEHETDYFPSSVYAESKVRTEELVRAGDGGVVTWCLVRPPTVWGPGMGPTYQRFVRMVARGRYFHLGPSDRTKPSIFVGNISAQLERLITAAPAEIHGKTINLGDYKPPTVREWADAFQRCLGARRIPTVPVVLARGAAHVGDQLQRVVPSFPFVTTRLNNVLASCVRDTSEAERICGPLPYTLEAAIEETVEWLHRIGVVDHGCVA